MIPAIDFKIIQALLFLKISFDKYHGRHNHWANCSMPVSAHHNGRIQMELACQGAQVSLKRLLPSLIFKFRWSESKCWVRDYSLTRSREKGSNPAIRKSENNYSTDTQSWKHLPGKEPARVRKFKGINASLHSVPNSLVIGIPGRGRFQGQWLVFWIALNMGMKKVWTRIWDTDGNAAPKRDRTTALIARAVAAQRI